MDPMGFLVDMVSRWLVDDPGGAPVIPCEVVRCLGTR